MTSNLQVRIDSNLKAQATKIFDNMGLTASDVVRLLFIAVVKNHKLPFVPFPEYLPNLITHETMQEVEDRKNLTAHASVDALMSSLDDN